MGASESSVGRAVTLTLAAVIAFAFVGYAVGLRQELPQSPGLGAGPDVALGAGTARPAPSYGELAGEPLGPNADFASDFRALVGRGPEVLVGTEIVITDADKRAALAERTELRAYNGAPPTIPHTVDAVSAAACLACHEKGLVVGGRVARPMPHEPYAQCTQCHVPALEMLGEPLLSVANRFDGLPAPHAGERAGPGAPPVVPHTTHMRTNCLACHGPLGRYGIRTTHPWRQSCLQCHAPSAELDQLLVGDGSVFLDSGVDGR